MERLRKKIIDVIFISTLLLSLFFVSQIFAAGEQNANWMFWYDNSSSNWMYCQVNWKIWSSSNGAVIDWTSSRTLQSFNPIFLFDQTQSTWFSINFSYLNNSLYHPVNAYYTNRPQSNSWNWKASMLAWYFVSWQAPWTYEVATYSVWPKYWVAPVVTWITLKFLIDKNDDSNDSNIPISINWRDILSSWPDLKVGFVAKPCLPDVKSPELWITSISNGAYRVPSNTIINFYVEDRNWQKYNYNWLWLWTFTFKSLNWNDVSTWNYDFDANMDNQYGVYSGSIFSRINWFGYSHDYTKADIENYWAIYWNGLYNWRYENFKWYTGYYYAKSWWNIEEQITISLSWRDSSPDWPSASQSSITFNTPRAFNIENPIPWNGATNVDPELISFGVRVYDDRASVDSWSLVVTIRTWSQNWKILKEFSWIELQLVSYEKFFPAEWVWSISMTWSLNYSITLTWVWPFPENTSIYVVVSGYDLAYNPNPTQRYFSFTTRKSCKAIQCWQWVSFYTWTLLTWIFYTQQIVTVSWWDSPYISWNQLVCNSQWFSWFDMYTGWDKIDYW